MYNDPHQHPPLPIRRTSRLGKASFMIGIGIFSLVIASVVVMLFVALNDIKAANTVIAITVVGWILAPAGHFIGLVLGIIDVCRRDSKKLVPVLGIVGNAILGGIGLTLLVIVGNMALQTIGAFT